MLKLKPGQLQTICKRYDINTLYLFGSFVNGGYSEDSDIDLAFLTAGPGARAHNLDYGRLYFDLQECSARKIDLLDLRKVPLSMAFDIMKTGKVLYDHNEEIRTDFEDRVIRKYLDFSTFRRLMQAEIDESFGLEANQ